MVRNCELSYLAESQEPSRAIYLDSPQGDRPTAIYRIRGTLIAGSVAILSMWGGYQWSQATAAREMLEQEQRHNEQLSSELSAARDKLAEKATNVFEGLSFDLSSLNSNVMIIAGAVIVGAVIIAGARQAQSGGSTMSGIIAGAMIVVLLFLGLTWR